MIKLARIIHDGWLKLGTGQSPVYRQNGYRSSKRGIKRISLDAEIVPGKQIYGTIFCFCIFRYYHAKQNRFLKYRGENSLMAGKFTLEQIRQFWTEQAQRHGISYAASWSDQPVIEMEIQEILRWLSDGDRILDVGCANGYSTVQFAAHKQVTIRGLDYIPEMIEQANHRLENLHDKLLGKVSFGVGDITALNEPIEEYNRVIVIRVLINLENWSAQIKGLEECVRVLEPGGLLLLSEATLQGWTRLNQFRQEWGLSEVPMPPFNQYLDQDKVIQAVQPSLELVDIINFSSTYFVGTRVLKPLLIQALGADINVANPDMEWNRWFAQLPAVGDYGTQKLFVFRKIV